MHHLPAWQLHIVHDATPIMNWQSKKDQDTECLAAELLQPFAVPASDNGHTEVRVTVLKIHQDLHESKRFLLDAVDAGDVPVVEALLDHIVEVIDVDEKNNTVLHWAATHAHAALVETICARYPNLVTCVNKYEQSPLHLAVQAGFSSDANVMRIVQCLVTCRADVHARDEQGWTALHEAVHYSVALSAARVLIENGAEVDCLDRYQQTPLTEAIRFNKHKHASLLMQHGADWNRATDHMAHEEIAAFSERFASLQDRL